MPSFQSFWFGERLPPYQHLAMKSFVDYGHSYILYAYRMYEVPRGVILRDANEILPEQRLFLYGEAAGVGRGSIAAFANLFRYHLLYRMGGWWVDTDVVCLKDTVPSAEIFMGWEYAHQINNAILRFPAEHILLRQLRDIADQAGPDLVWGATGPALITRLVTELGLLRSVSDQPFAYPVQSANALDLLIPSRFDDISNCTQNRSFLHLWNEIFRRAVIFTWMAPPAGSFMAALFERHCIDFASAPAYTADQIQRLNDNFVAATTWVQQFVGKTELEILVSRLGAREV